VKLEDNYKEGQHSFKLEKEADAKKFMVKVGGRIHQDAPFFPSTYSL
jgi:hypothetical protein